MQPNGQPDNEALAELLFQCLAKWLRAYVRFCTVRKNSKAFLRAVDELWEANEALYKALMQLKRADPGVLPEPPESD